jgi:hypothetical protein
MREMHLISEKVFSTLNNLISVVAQKVLQDSVRFNEATLNCSPIEYAQWIKFDTRFNLQFPVNRSWGGDVELNVLSEHLKMGIDCIELQSGYIYRYGENYPRRCILIYLGTHYDCIVYTPVPESFQSVTTNLDPNTEFYTRCIFESVRLLIDTLRVRGYRGSFETGGDKTEVNHNQPEMGYCQRLQKVPFTADAGGRSVL